MTKLDIINILKAHGFRRMNVVVRTPRNAVNPTKFSLKKMFIDEDWMMRIDEVVEPKGDYTISRYKNSLNEYGISSEMFVFSFTITLNNTINFFTTSITDEEFCYIFRDYIRENNINNILN